jgi:plastocyanin domain-containing protein
MRYLMAIAAVACSSILLSACSEAPPVPTKQLSNGTQEIVIRVKSGYHPSVIEAKPDKPLILKFFRDEVAGVHSCDQALSIPSQHISRPLPAQKEEVITIPAQKDGTEIAFECGMKMMKGMIRYNSKP